MDVTERSVPYPVACCLRTNFLNTYTRQEETISTYQIQLRKQGHATISLVAVGRTSRKYGTLASITNIQPRLELLNPEERLG